MHAARCVYSQGSSVASLVSAEHPSTKQLLNVSLSMYHCDGSDPTRFGSPSNTASAPGPTGVPARGHHGLGQDGYRARWVPGTSRRRSGCPAALLKLKQQREPKCVCQRAIVLGRVEVRNVDTYNIIPQPGAEGQELTVPVVGMLVVVAGAESKEVAVPVLQPRPHRELLQQAIEDGGRTLDCYSGRLPEFYQSEGFRETGRIEFNPEFAPDDFNSERFGEPDVVFMAYDPEAEPVESDQYYDGDEFGQAKEDSRDEAVFD